MFSFIHRLLGSSQRHTRNKAAVRPSLEMLERRDLPSITLGSTGTTLTARGDDGPSHNDTFELRTNFNNGKFQIFQYDGANIVAQMDVPAAVTQINILGDGGTDTVLVKSLPSAVKLAMTDVDALTVGNNHKFAGIAGNMSLTTNSGGPKTAVTFAGDLDSEYHDQVKLSRDSLAGLTKGTLDFSQARLSSLIVNSGTGKDRIDVTSIKADTTLNTGGGSDEMYVYGDLMTMGGKLTLNGGDGAADRVGVSDLDGTLLNSNYTITAGAFTRSGLFTLPNGAVANITTTINYSGFETAAFETGGTGTSNVFITSTPGETLLYTRGASLVVVGNSANGLSDIKGGLGIYAMTANGNFTYNAGGQVILVDQGSTAHNYTIRHLSTSGIGVGVERDGDVQIYNLGLGVESLYAGSAGDTFAIGEDAYNPDYPFPMVVNGGGGVDTLIGLDTGSTFTITGADTGRVGLTTTFTAVENLKGGAAEDTFAFQANNQGVAGSLSGTIDGGGGINTLDYSALTTGVTVDLALRVAAGVFNNAANGIANVRNVIGSKGDDLLRGDNNANDIRGVDGNDILVGLDGNDTLKARGIDNIGAGTTRRCILVGGRGTDILEGSEGEDILLGGYFDNDFDDNSNDVLRAFMNVWKGPGDYTSRTRSLHNDGVQVSGHRFELDDGNIQRDDDASDTLTGNGGLDWFWIDGDDSTPGITGQEAVNDDV